MYKSIAMPAITPSNFLDALNKNCTELGLKKLISSGAPAGEEIMNKRKLKMYKLIFINLLKNIDVIYNNVF